MPRLISAEDMTGSAVLDQNGVKLGTIEDVMIDKSSGRVAYALLSFGDFLGIGGKHIALPWTILEYHRDHDAYVIPLDRHTLERAPAFDKDSPPDMEDEVWATEVHVYYSVQPYWREEGGHF